MWELDHKEGLVQRIEAFKLWWWRRLLRVSWIAKRSNQSILKEISPEYSLEGWMLKLKLQYFSHLMQRADSREKTLMLGDWRLKEKGATEDEMIGWHHSLNGRECKQTPGDSEEEGSLVHWGPWSHMASHYCNWATKYDPAVPLLCILSG